MQIRSFYFVYMNERKNLVVASTVCYMHCVYYTSELQ